MRRYFLYFAVALLTFGIGAFVVLKYRLITEEKRVIKEESNITTETQSEEIVGHGFGSATSDGRWNDTEYVPKLHKATCSDKELLPLWNELRKDNEFKKGEEYFYQDAADCTNAVEIQRKDLNDDGQKEFIVWGRYNFCGGTGNCLLWIYEKKNGKYKQLLQASAYYGESKWLEVKRAESKNYRNILLKGHFTGYETDHHFYKFNGSKYVENKCLFEVYSLDKNEPSMMTCKEYEKKSDEALRKTETLLKNR